MRYAIPVVALALVGAASIVYWRTSHAAESPHDKVDHLMPQLMSDDDKVRTDAERQVFALDGAGRDELDRVSRGADTRRAITALRLLQKPAWTDDHRSDAAMQHVGAEGVVAPTRGAEATSPNDLEQRVRGEIADMRRRMDEFDRCFPLDSKSVWPTGANVRAKAAGEFVENDRKLTWSIAEDGGVKVTTKDGKDAPEKSYDAKSLAELRTKAPDVAKRLDDAMPRAERGLVVRLAPPDPNALFDWGATKTEPMDHLVPPNVAPPVLGIEWSPPSAVLRDQLDVPGGMVVQSVVAGTPAEKLGLQHDDVLVELNGKAVSGSADVRAVLDPVKPGEKLAAVVVRKGRRQTLGATR